MILIRKNFLVAAGLCVLTMACEQDDPNLIDYEPGNRLAISGPAEVRVGESNVRYSLLNNRAEADYSWSVSSGLNLTEDTGNDAYVQIDEFNTPGTYELSVTRDDMASGSLDIDVLSREVSFQSESEETTETFENDTLAIPLEIGGGFNNDVTVSYSISGTMDEANYDVLPGYESPYTIDSAGGAQILVVVYPDTDLGSSNLVLNIDNVTSDNDQEYAIADTLQSITYEFTDDMKSVSIDTTELEISDPGVYEITVTLSNPASNEPVNVNYSITGAVAGVLDATPTSDEGTLSFESGETEKHIVLSVSDQALATDQTITITIDSITTDDAETEIDEEQSSKTVVLMSGS